jgi:hypothetical protein
MLLVDFNKYCEEIGITKEEKPRLITDRKTMDERTEANIQGQG